MAQTIDFPKLANFQPKQLEAWLTLLKPETKYELYGGAAAGGKSYFLRWAALGLALYFWQKYHIKGIPIGLFSEDYPTLKDRQISRIKKEFPRWMGELKESRDEGYLFQIRNELGGGMILLRNLDDPSKYASTEFAGEFVEELTKNPRDTFDDLRFRLRYPGIPEVKFAGATNPGSVGHGWVKSLWVKPDDIDPDKEADRFKFIRANYEDNKYISEGYITQLSTLPEQKRRAYMDGSWEIFEGQFFSDFRHTLHVIDPFKPKSTFVKVGGLDWGYSSPFAFTASFVQRSEFKERKFHRLWTYDELYGVEKSPHDWAVEIMKNYNLDEFAIVEADPSIFNKKSDGSRSIADEFKEVWGRNGWKLKPAANNRETGWVLMHHWLQEAPDGLPYWLISSKCSNLVRELSEAVYSSFNTEDLDTKGSDHALDATRYAQTKIEWIDAKLGMRQDIKISTIPRYRSSLDLAKFEIDQAATRTWKER